MDTLTLEKILLNDPQTAPYFRGVFPKDHFLKEFAINPRGLFIFNTHTSDKPGEHWLAVSYIDGKVLYFDSYGLKPSPSLQELLARPAPLDFKGKPIQSPLTAVCGDYCLLFCLLISRGWTREDFERSMLGTKAGEKRDHAVRRLIINLFGHLLSPVTCSTTLSTGVHSTHPPGLGFIDFI